jgi:thiol-disulfide isomerase/thioredoxin
MAANLPDSNQQASDPLPPSLGIQIRNLLIVLVAVVLSVSIVLGLKTETGAGRLSVLADEAVPLNVAMENKKPTLMEFYANWCTSCQAMAADLQALKQQYGDRVNFVMLNVDNSKWLPEILHYRVDGIPHFVFLGNDGIAIAEAIGELPHSILAANLAALVDHAPLPYAQATGQTSAFSAPVAPNSTAAANPRSHGSQVVN